MCYEASELFRCRLGKNKVEDESDSDSDVDDEDSEDLESADAKSVVVDEGNYSNGSRKNEEKLDLGSVSGSSHSEGESSGEKSQLTTSSGAEGGDFESGDSAELQVGMLDHPISVAAASEEVTADEDNTALATSNQNNPDVPQVEEVRKADKDNTASATSNQNNQEVPQVEQHVDVSNSYSGPLDLAKYSSSAELEVCFFFSYQVCSNLLCRALVINFCQFCSNLIFI